MSKNVPYRGRLIAIDGAENYRLFMRSSPSLPALPTVKSAGRAASSSAAPAISPSSTKRRLSASPPPSSPTKRFSPTSFASASPTARFRRISMYRLWHLRFSASPRACQTVPNACLLPPVSLRRSGRNTGFCLRLRCRRIYRTVRCQSPIWPTHSALRTGHCISTKKRG